VSAASSATSAARTREWLALSATPGLGPTRIKRLLERFGDVGQVFRASLTELEAAGIPAASAQSIALGSSMQLADEERGIPRLTVWGWQRGWPATLRLADSSYSVGWLAVSIRQRIAGR
jgi:predicted Rossmann fold nucleotide-binding protein DprA/Smf involved in DNA uptake